MSKIHKREKEMLLMKLSQQRREYRENTASVVESYIILHFDSKNFKFTFDKYANKSSVIALVSREEYTLQELKRYLDIDEVWFEPFQAMWCDHNNDTTFSS